MLGDKLIIYKLNSCVVGQTLFNHFDMGQQVNSRMQMTF